MTAAGATAHPGPAEQDKPFVIRLKAPQRGRDHRPRRGPGRGALANDQLDDMVLLRSDGTPTYMLAVVVDDFDMGVTHVIRGADHLNNAARQLQIIDAMGWPVPVYGHVPLIHGADGAKLSKRHGALAVEAYRDMGYLPEAMRNYLLRLGWSHGDDEIIPTAQAIEWFDLEGIGSSAARFDLKKLDNLNGHYIRETGRCRAGRSKLVAFAERAKPAAQSSMTARATRLKAAMPFLKTRAKTLVELVDKAEFLFTDGPARPMPAAAPSPDAGRPRAARPRLPGASRPRDWDAPALEARVRGPSPRRKGIKLGDVAQPLRAALTGKDRLAPDVRGAGGFGPRRGIDSHPRSCRLRHQISAAAYTHRWERNR